MKYFWPILSIALVVALLWALFYRKPPELDAVIKERDTYKAAAKSWADSAVKFHAAFLKEAQRADSIAHDTIRIADKHEKNRLDLRGLTPDSVRSIVAKELGNSL